MNEAFSVKRLQGLRTIRDLVIASEKGSCQRLHRTFRRLRQKRDTANEQDSQVQEEVMENVVMAAECFLHQKPRECDVMDVEESLHQKPREVCISEDTECIDLGVVRKHEVESCEKRHSITVTGWRSRFEITGHILRR